MSSTLSMSIDSTLIIIDAMNGVHVKTRNELEQAGTTWNELELAGTSWNHLEQAGTK